MEYFKRLPLINTSRYFQLYFRIPNIFRKTCNFSCLKLGTFWYQYSFIVPIFDYLQVPTAQSNFLYGFFSHTSRFFWIYLQIPNSFFEKKKTFSLKKKNFRYKKTYFTNFKVLSINHSSMKFCT